MKVKWFACFTLGEGLQNKSVNFDAEVAAQNKGKEVHAAPQAQPVVVET